MQYIKYTFGVIIGISGLLVSSDPPSSAYFRFPDEKSFLTRIPGRCNGSLQFDCGDKNEVVCISIEGVKNGTKECSDGSDEMCAYNQLKCKKEGHCVEESKFPEICASNEKKKLCNLDNVLNCKSYGECILNSWILDGKTFDCLDHSDEDCEYVAKNQLLSNKELKARGCRLPHSQEFWKCFNAAEEKAMKKFAKKPICKCGYDEYFDENSGSCKKSIASTSSTFEFKANKICNESIEFVEHLQDKNTDLYKRFASVLLLAIAEIIENSTLDPKPEICFPKESMDEGSIRFTVKFQCKLKDSDACKVDTIKGVMISSSTDQSTSTELDKTHVKDIRCRQCHQYAVCSHVNSRNAIICTCEEGYIDLNPNNPGRKCIEQNQVQETTTHKSSNQASNTSLSSIWPEQSRSHSHEATTQSFPTQGHETSQSIISEQTTTVSFSSQVSLRYSSETTEMTVHRSSSEQSQAQRTATASFSSQTNNTIENVFSKQPTTEQSKVYLSTNPSLTSHQMTESATTPVFSKQTYNTTESFTSRPTSENIQSTHSEQSQVQVTTPPSFPSQSTFSKQASETVHTSSIGQTQPHEAKTQKSGHSLTQESTTSLRLSSEIHTTTETHSSVQPLQTVQSSLSAEQNQQSTSQGFSPEHSHAQETTKSSSLLMQSVVEKTTRSFRASTQVYDTVSSTTQSSSTMGEQSEETITQNSVDFSTTNASLPSVLGQAQDIPTTDKPKTAIGSVWIIIIILVAISAIFVFSYCLWRHYCGRNNRRNDQIEPEGQIPANFGNGWKSDTQNEVQIPFQKFQNNEEAETMSQIEAVVEENVGRFIDTPTMWEEYQRGKLVIRPPLSNKGFPNYQIITQNNARSTSQFSHHTPSPDDGFYSKLDKIEEQEEDLSSGSQQRLMSARDADTEEYNKWKNQMHLPSGENSPEPPLQGGPLISHPHVPTISNSAVESDQDQQNIQ